jgi:outer membrane protein assembly factor BamB
MKRTIFLLALAACAPNADSGPDAGTVATRVELPGVSGGVGWDDINYAPALGRVIAPARAHGVALVDPDTLDVTMLTGLGDAASAVEGAGVLFVADRSVRRIVAVDPATGDTIATAPLSRWPDYVRFDETRREVWVTEPGSGVEVLAFDPAAPSLTAVDVVSTSGPEGLAISSARRRAYVHGSGSTIVAIDLDTRTVVDSWSYGCDGSHGIPAIDEADGMLLAGCGRGGVHLLDLVDDAGTDLGGQGVGDGAPLMAFSSITGRFYARSDPGGKIESFTPASGLPEGATLDGSETGHCLVADDRGNVWTADADTGELVRATPAR